MNIVLNEVEQQLAKLIAHKRYTNARQHNVVDQKKGPQSNYETDLDGIGAELAYCKIFNLYPDTSIVLPTPKEDCITRDGLRCDIKTTKFETGHLIVAPWKINKNPCDIYALMVGEFPRYRYAGYNYRDYIFNDNNLKDFGWGKVYAIKQNNLIDNS